MLRWIFPIEISRYRANKPLCLTFLTKKNEIWLVTSLHTKVWYCSLIGYFIIVGAVSVPKFTLCTLHLKAVICGMSCNRLKHTFNVTSSCTARVSRKHSACLVDSICDMYTETVWQPLAVNARIDAPLKTDATTGGSFMEAPLNFNVSFIRIFF